MEKSTTPLTKEEKIGVRAEFSTNTYSKGIKILESANEELISKTINGQKTINKAFNQLKENQKKDVDNDINSKELPKVSEVSQSDLDSELKNIKEMFLNFEKSRKYGRNFEMNGEVYYVTISGTFDLLLWIEFII